MSLLSQHAPERESLTRGVVSGSPFRKDYSFQSKYSPGYVRYDQPQALLEYELSRQKEKSRILEERLKNKEIFIAQMKEFQAELTQAFDESQQELQFFKGRCQQLEGANGRSRDNEEIVELKRLLQAVEQDKRKLEEELRGERYRKERSQSRPSLQKSKTDHNLNRDPSVTALKQRLADTLAKSLNSTVEEVTKEIKPIGKFLSYFFTMVETCNSSQLPSSLKEQLRFGWKWVKAIVKEHTDTTTSAQKPTVSKDNRSVSQAQSHQLASLARLMNVAVSDLHEQLESLVHQHRQSDRIVKLVAEFCGLPPQSSLKHLERAMRQRIGRGRHDQH